MEETIRAGYNFLYKGKPPGAGGTVCIAVQDEKKPYRIFVVGDGQRSFLHRAIGAAQLELSWVEGTRRKTFKLDTVLDEKTSVKELFLKAIEKGASVDERELNATDKKQQEEEKETKRGKYELLSVEDGAILVRYGKQKYKVSPETVTNQGSGKKIAENSAAARAVRKAIRAAGDASMLLV